MERKKRTFTGDLKLQVALAVTIFFAGELIFTALVVTFHKGQLRASNAGFCEKYGFLSWC